MSERILILGGTSDIAHATARRFAAEGATIALVGRDEEALARVAADLQGRGAEHVTSHCHDLATVDAAAFVQWVDGLKGLDTVILAYGILGDQVKAEQDPSVQRDILEVNFVSAAGWLNAAAHELQTRGGGTIAVFGSVAGDRARKPNYIYGSAKAGLHFYAEGMALALADAGVNVVLMKPGQTRTRMTQHLDTTGALWSSADRVAEDAFRAIRRRQHEVYSPWFWRWIMRVIGAIPRSIFRRMSF